MNSKFYPKKFVSNLDLSYIYKTDEKLKNQNQNANNNMKGNGMCN